MSIGTSLCAASGWWPDFEHLMDDRALIGACLTAPGEGGLHVFRVRGQGVDRLLDHVFRPATGGRASGLRYGHLMDGDRVVDEVVVVHGGNGEAEISTHGGDGVRAAVTSLLERSGVTVVEAAGLLVEDRPGPAIGAEARDGLSRARCVQGLLFYLAALEGGLAAEVSAVRDVVSRDPDAAIRTSLVRRIDALLGRASFGCAFGAPPVILVAGPPNAGKSTLANRLIGRDRCIVTPDPGTTRDLVGEDLGLDGYPFRIVDSAGVRDTDDPVEAAGVQRTLAAGVDADLILLVVDGSVPLPADPHLERLTARPGVILVLNKQDLGAGPDPDGLARRLRCPVVRVSALEGFGADVLVGEALFRSPFRGPATRDFPCPFTERQLRCLQAARRAVRDDPGAASGSLTEMLEGVS